MTTTLRLVVAAAVSGALYAAGVFFPLVATPFLLLVPLPGLILGAYASREATLWLVLSAMSIGATLGPEAACGFALLFGVPTLASALGFRRRWPFEITVLAALALWSLGVAGVAVAAYGNLAAIVETARQQLNHGVDLALSTYGSLGTASENTVALMQAERDGLVTALLEILPALIVLSGALTVILNLILLRSWSDAAREVDLRRWRTPDGLIWALIAAGFGMFLPYGPLAIVTRNLFLIVLGCYFCQGLAIVSYFLERLHLPRGLRIASYLLIAVQHIVAGIVLALGIFDLWGNFRRLSAGLPDMHVPSDGE